MSFSFFVLEFWYWCRYLFLLVSKVFVSLSSFICIFWSFYFLSKCNIRTYCYEQFAPICVSCYSHFYRKCKRKVGIIWLLVIWLIYMFIHAITLSCDLSLLIFVISFFLWLQRQTWIGIGLQEILGRISFIRLGKGWWLPYYIVLLCLVLRMPLFIPSRYFSALMCFFVHAGERSRLEFDFGCIL